MTFQGRFKEVLRKFQGYFTEVESFKIISRECKWYFKSVSRVFQVSFKRDSSKFQASFK